jgi:hypothetical protein
MTTTSLVTPPRGATALDLLSSLAGPASDGEARASRPRIANWCERCGAPRNLGRRDCPGCALLADSRERIVTYLARHGMPPGGAVELARLADVPLRAVGAMMAGSGPRSRYRMERTAR